MDIKRKIACAFLCLPAFALAVFTVLLCLHGVNAKTVILGESEPPSACVEEFFTLAFSGDYAGAEKCLGNVQSLGLNRESGDSVGRLLYAGLQDSFSWQMIGGSTLDGAEAVQRVSVTYLDLPSLTACQQELINARLAQYLEQAERAEDVQNDDGTYKQSVAMQALEEISGELLQSAEKFYVSAEFDIRLQFTGKEWKIIADENLFAVLSGNMAY